MKDFIGVDRLQIEFHLPKRRVKVLSEMSVSFEKGKIVGIIGESGSGKSVLGMAMLGILPPYARVSGDFYLDGMYYRYGSKEQKRLLGQKIGFIPQNPQEALNPSRKIKKQLDEALSIKYKTKEERRRRAIELLQSMGFSEVEKILESYPHELSGGMQQRALSAISVCCNPSWIIADEPTKGLDKKLCDQVADTFIKLKQFDVEGMIIITHDIALAQQLCDEILVMYRGMVLERGPDVIHSPSHPYTKALIESMPQHSLMPIPDPVAINQNDGCVFASRCEHRMNKCVRCLPPDV